MGLSLMKKTEPTIHLVLSVPTLAEHFDHMTLFETLVRRYRCHAPSSSFTVAGSPRSFTFSCQVPRSKVSQFRAEWRKRTLDLSDAQKKRLSLPVSRMFKQLRDQLGQDDFSLLIRSIRRPATRAWLTSCAAPEAKTAVKGEIGARINSSGAAAITPTSKDGTAQKRAKLSRS